MIADLVDEFIQKGHVAIIREHLEGKMTVDKLLEFFGETKRLMDHLEGTGYYVKSRKRIADMAKKKQ
jgi:hypothetical protein